MRRKLEVDAENYRKEREAIEREERLVRRRKIREEEECLQQLRTVTEPLQVVNIHTPSSEIRSAGFEGSYLSERGAAGVAHRRQDSCGPLDDKSEDRDRDRVNLKYKRR